MRSLSWLLISLCLAPDAGAQVAPPARIEIEFELKRNGSTMAEVVERLEHGNGGYQLTETWKGKGLYALLGRAKRTSQGSLGADGPRPHEYIDERSGQSRRRARRRTLRACHERDARPRAWRCRAPRPAQALRRRGDC